MPSKDDSRPARLDLSGAGVRRARALSAGEPGAAASPWPAMAGRLATWIELLAALGLDPHALWPAAVAIDFEGDQWTAVEPSRDELRALYGIDVQELVAWRPLAEHAIEHLSAGRPLLIEADAFRLPIAADADHHRHHVKTTIVLNEIDLGARRIGYFHHAGYGEARGDDVTRLLDLEDDTSDLEAIADWRGARVAQVGAAAVALDEGRLPPHVQSIRADRRVARSTTELRMLALHHLDKQLAFRPATNPLRRFADRLADDLPLLREYGTGYYADWAACTLRTFGPAFELVARGLAWQAKPGPASQDAARAFEQLAQDAKALEQKLARAVASTRKADTNKLLDAMAQRWDEGMAALEAA
jgi:hypothetical protein